MNGPLFSVFWANYTQTAKNKRRVLCRKTWPLYHLDEKQRFFLPNFEGILTDVWHAPSTVSGNRARDVLSLFIFRDEVEGVLDSVSTLFCEVDTTSFISVDISSTDIFSDWFSSGPISSSWKFVETVSTLSIWPLASTEVVLTLSLITDADFFRVTKKLWRSDWATCFDFDLSFCLSPESDIHNTFSLHIPIKCLHHEQCLMNLYDTSTSKQTPKINTSRYLLNQHYNLITANG